MAPADTTCLSSSMEPYTQEKSRENRVIYIAREREIKTRNRIQEHRRARRRREKMRNETRRDTGNDGGGREQVQAPDARPARSSVGNSRPLLSRTSTSSPAHRRRPLHGGAQCRIDHAHRRPSTTNEAISTTGSNENQEESLSGARLRSPAFGTYPPL